MRKLLLFLAIAIVVSLAIAQFSKPAPYSEQLIHIQAEQELGHIDKAILNEKLPIQALLLDYSGDKELTLKAWIALSKYPEKTRKIFLLYGSEPQFKEILRKYGESIIPVIQYFIENDVWSVKAKDIVKTTFDEVKAYGIEIWRHLTGNGQQPDKKPVAHIQPHKIGSEERGWYAVNFIKQEGNDLLGQFVVGKDEKIKRNQTDRITKGLISFFTSGIRNLETKHDLGENITTSDMFWAGVDVAMVAAPVKILGAGGKVVGRTGKELNLTTRTKIFAPRLLSEGKIFRKLGKYGAVAATAYIIIKHPSLINSVFAELAQLLDLNPLLVQIAGWSLIIFLVLYPISWLLKPLAQSVLFGLSWIERSRKKITPNVTSATMNASGA
ncbi:hypothetical protein [Sulfurirhabdus autotrophica]|uniref:hypothetical protein n=1 Tax=Sulfurirhabdus autotrophica TaxID=1706046 RepID=UPI000F604F73|nr:hypothetical protein [Sulfurirhabdus autotrophica]